MKNCIVNATFIFSWCKVVTIQFSKLMEIGNNHIGKDPPKAKGTIFGINKNGKGGTERNFDDAMKISDDSD